MPDIQYARMSKDGKTSTVHPDKVRELTTLGWVREDCPVRDVVALADVRKRTGVRKKYPTVAVVCAGPSLDAVIAQHPLRKYDAVIACNLAGELHPCDWWICCDSETFRMFDGKPRVGIAGGVAGFLAGTAEMPTNLCDKAIHCTGWVHQTPIKAWNTTMPVAIAFAAHAFTPKRIDCLGVDWDGDTYCDGRIETQKPRRWENERREVAEVIDHYAIDVRILGGASL